MLTLQKWTKNPEGRKALLARADMVQSSGLTDTVAAILSSVQERGDPAVAAYTEKFDRVCLSGTKIDEAELQKAADGLSAELRAGFDVAIKNITAFHTAQKPAIVQVSPMPGVSCKMEWRPIERVGLYVPGGTAPLFSAVFMLAVPAVLAGCRQIVLCAPPQKNGQVNPETLAAARLCGIKDVFAIGGAQAIAAMAYGTQTVPKVDKILGPGNAYVTMAKQLVSTDPCGAATDMPAGPSEVMCLAGPEANPVWVAADLLAQAEHDVVSQSLLVTYDEGLALKVRQEVLAQMQSLSRRSIIEQSLKISRIIVVENEDEAVEVANLYAPEHLIIYGQRGQDIVPRILNAASVFLGDMTPETAGDYASGTNHVLPTYGYARAYSGLSLYSFLRSMTVQSLTKEGLKGLAPTLVGMATAEGLDAHAQAVRCRFQKDGGAV